MRRRRRFGLLAVLLAGVFLIHVILRTRIDPLIESVALAAVDDAASNLINDTVNRQITRGDIQYSDLITLVQQDNGGIVALTTNMREMNRLKTELLKLLDSEIAELDEDMVSVPLGNFTGLELLSGRGPALPVKVVSMSSSEAEFHGEFYDAGINQTIHRILLRVSLDLLILLPGGVVTDRVTSELCVAETVLLGQVPEYYSYHGADGESIYFGSE